MEGVMVGEGRRKRATAVSLEAVEAKEASSRYDALPRPDRSIALFRK